MSVAQQEHTPSLLGFHAAPNPRAAAEHRSGTQTRGHHCTLEHQRCRLGRAVGSGTDSGQHGQEQEAVLPSGFWQALPQAAGQHLRVLSQSPSDWHPTVQFTSSIAGLGHTPAFAARQRWGRGQERGGRRRAGRGLRPFPGDAAPAPGLGPGMLPSPNAPGTAWCSPRPPRRLPWGWEGGMLAARRACPDEPCWAMRSYSLVSFWADAAGSSAQRARNPAKMRTLRAAGMVQEPAALWPPGRPLSSSPGGAGGLGLPGGSQGPGRARLPLRACTTRVSGICCCWLPTREGEPRGDWAAMLRTRPAGTAAKHPRARPAHAGPQTAPH